MDEEMRALAGQRALITGGGSGIGAAIARALAAAGADIHLVGRRLEMLETVAADVRRAGAEARCHKADLASTTACCELTQQLASNLPHLDILVHSAGIYLSGPFEQLGIDELDALYRTNVRAPYALTHGLLVLLKAQRGQIVFINSSVGLGAKATDWQYASTKHAIKAIADGVRAELNVHGVRVLSVFPGRVATEMQARVYQLEGRPYRPELLLQPDDVASVIVNALSLPRTAEVTDIHIRPMNKT